MGSESSRFDRLRPAAEAVVLGMACLGPWAIGAVDAWAQLILDGGLLILALLQLLGGRPSDWARRLFCLPSLALVGLTLYALVQAMPLPAAVERTIAPATRAWRAGLAPERPERVQADAGPGVSPPARTISHDPDASVRTAAQLAAAWLLFQVVLGLGTGPRLLRRFGFLTVANASLVTIFSIAQSLAWNGKIYGVRAIRGGQWFVGGPFVSHNHLAAYLNLAFGLSLGLLLATIQKTRTGQSRRSARASALWAGSAAGLIFAGIVASHSRGGFLAAVCSATATLVLLRPRSVRLGPALGVMVVIAGLFLIVMGSTSPFERLASIKDAGHDGFDGRTQVWSIALRTWRSFPIWGTGLGSFPAATGSFYRQQFLASYFSHAESEYLQILSEGGIVGLALALLAAATIARLGWRALAAAGTPPERALVLGALASGLALLFQCLSDFPLHIPGVAVTAVVLAGHLVRLGLEATGSEPAAEPRPARLGRRAVGVAMVGLSVVLVLAGVRLARAEALVRSVGLPFPGSYMPSVESARAGDAELQRTQNALEAALRLRPNWAEGYLRLGAVLLARYSNAAEQALGAVQEQTDPEALRVLSDPLWLHGVVHSASREDLAKIGPVIDLEQVRGYLVPAARCFLEARRCSPDLAAAHARLAEVDYLIDGGEPTAVHVSRALRLSGYDHLVLLVAGDAAAQAGDIDLAAGCWQKALALHPDGWNEIALAAALAMPPEQILEKVLPPGGRFPLLIADGLYAGPEWRAVREKFLRASIERSARDAALSPTERLWIEGQARARLDERDRARKLMTAALVAEPSHPDWREEFIDFLIAWGNLDEASRQARIGLTLNPDHAGLQRASRSAIDAFAQGEGTPERPD